MRFWLAVICGLLLLVGGTASARRHKENLAETISSLLNHRAVDPNAPVVVGFSPGIDGYRGEDVVLQAISEVNVSIHLAAYRCSTDFEFTL